MLGTHTPEHYPHVHSQLQECLWCVRAQLCQARGSVLEPKCVHLCGLSMADYKHPPACPRVHVTPLSVRVPRVSGCICQGLQGRTFRREAQFWNISPQGTVLLTSQNVPGAVVGSPGAALLQLQARSLAGG